MKVGGYKIHEGGKNGSVEIVDGRILAKSTYWKYQQLDPTEARLV